MSTQPRPPAGLTPATRAWWRDVTSGWELESHHLKLLAICCRAWDEAEAASELVRRDGLTVVQPSGAVRPNPALRIANEARALYARCLRELDLDVQPPADAQRPPQLRSIAGGRS